jgi:catechol 2,3-dioxygenase-like lactoylglutathione lyase family enzyme
MSHTTAPAAIGTGVANVIVPVSDVRRARAWYREALGLSVGEVLFGHLCVIDLPSGAGILLDQQLVPGGEAVQNGHWFNVRDSEGNLLMLCGPRPTAGG